jgi:hypothetical protein
VEDMVYAGEEVWDAGIEVIVRVGDDGDSHDA